LIGHLNELLSKNKQKEGNVKSFMKELQENIIDKGKEDSHGEREIILMKRMVAATFKLRKRRLMHKNAG